MQKGRMPATEPTVHTAAPDEPMSILAALIDGLTSGESYTVEARNGELFVAPMRPRSQPHSLRHAA
jgi:hypothetical protein